MTTATIEDVIMAWARIVGYDEAIRTLARSPLHDATFDLLVDLLAPLANRLPAPRTRPGQ
jgi:hypothetical protein